MQSPSHPSSHLHDGTWSTLLHGPLLTHTSNPLNTQGVQNINDRFSKAGGTETGTPAVASPLNSAEKQGTLQTYENNIASGKSASNSKSASSGSESGTPGKEQVHEGAPGANANAQDKKGKTGREQSHGNRKSSRFVVTQLYGPYANTRPVSERH